MTEAAVYFNDRLAGTLRKTKEGEFIFSYDPPYFTDASAPSISLSLPKSRREHQSPVLFPFFSGLLSEGDTRRQQQALLDIDPADDFALLLHTAQVDTVGAITVRTW
jgi:HipA-like protein